MKEIFQSCLLLLGGMLVVLLLQQLQTPTETVPMPSPSLPESHISPEGHIPQNTALDTWEVTVLGTGKSDCILVQDQDFVLLIDTAEQSDFPILQYQLNALGIEVIDLLLITHYDKDHVGGAGDLISQYQVNSVVVPDFQRESNHVTRFETALEEKNLQPLTLQDSMALELPSGEAVFQPTSIDFPEGEDNNSSIILSLYLDSYSLLFMGDAEAERIEEFLLQDQSQYDFLKIPHHGRYNKMTEALIASVQPEFAVLTSSLEDPAEEKTLDILEKYGVELWDTVDGTVKISEFMGIAS